MPTENALLDHLDVFYGEVTVHRALVYARAPRPAGDGWSLTGQVRGPRCLHAQSLPAATRLVDLGPGPTLLAQAVIPDPCSWTPDVPGIYDVAVQLLRGSDVIATARRELGLRRLGVRGRELFLDGKRWVLRGVSASSTTAGLAREWHDGLSALVVSSFTEELLAEAAQWGALVAVELGPAESSVTQVVKLARCPAVAIAVIHGELPRGFHKSAFAPNLLLAQPIAVSGAPSIAPWAEVAIVEVHDQGSFAAVAARLELPVIAQRRLPAPLPFAAARAACDALQRDLAPLGQFAGYVV